MILKGWEKHGEYYYYTKKAEARTDIQMCIRDRERSIQEISGQIQDYALPFFARFSNLPKLLDDVEQEGFFPHRKGVDVPKRNREFIECFREYLKKT